MASDKDRLFEKIYFLWKGEGEMRNQSMDVSGHRFSPPVIIDKDNVYGRKI